MSNDLSFQLLLRMVGGWQGVVLQIVLFFLEECGMNLVMDVFEDGRGWFRRLS